MSTNESEVHASNSDDGVGADALLTRPVERKKQHFYGLSLLVVIERGHTFKTC